MNYEIQMMGIQLDRKRAVIVASIGLAILTTSALASAQQGHGSANASHSAADSAAGMMGEGMMGEGMMGGDMMSRMKNMHSMMHGDTGGGMMGGGMMGGGMMGGGMMGGGMMGGDDLAYDSDSDGTTSVEELREALQSELTDFDADSNGVLDIGEFEKLHSARIRNQMVDRFQALDEDGDGQVTQDEMIAPAVKMQRRMDHQAKSGSMPGMQGGAMQPSADDTE